MALLSMAGNSSSSSVGSSITSTISPDAVFILLMILGAIGLICGLVYLIVKIGDLAEAKRRYYLKLASQKVEDTK